MGVDLVKIDLVHTPAETRPAQWVNLHNIYRVLGLFLRGM